tara:strand:- start:1213 stop:1566 length:354 start_codon:yes stop_codon:yes gene_type:complete
MNYWIIDEIWREIKTYLFHNIKIHGKHLKNDIHIQKFNETLKDIPKLYITASGPRIIYNFNKFKFAKFLYKIPAPSNISNKRNMYKLIIEYVPISNKTNEKIKELYMKNIITTNKVY